MQPVRLELQAFGSYGDRLDVDFVRLGAQGIFSITGPTGAGKTTIFDALCFALYGEVPGSRSGVEVRSHFADDDTETIVRFEFAVRGVRWSIERAPAWTRPKRRGTGTTTSQARVCLRCEDGSEAPLTKTREVLTRVESLIGLTAEQFQQAVLLPQGRFEAVLKASTGDRSQLLRRLFPVDIYTRIAQKLNDEADSRRRELDDKRTEVSGTLTHAREQLRDASASIAVPSAPFPEFDNEAGFEAADLDEISSRLEAYVTEAHAKEAATRDASQASDRALDTATASAAAYDQWSVDIKTAEQFAIEEASDAEIATHLELRSMVATQRDAIEAWERSTSDVATLHSSTEARIDILLDAGLASDVESLRDRAIVRGLHEDARGRLVSMEGAANELRQLSLEEATLEGLRTTAAESSSLLQQLREDEQIDVTETQRLEELVAASEGLAVVTEQLAERLRALTGERERGTALAQIHQQLGAAQERVGSAAQSLKSAEGHAAALHQAWRTSISAILAEGLVDGEPCPICGSKTHPAPANVDCESVSDEELTDADNAVRAAQQEHTVAVAAVATLEGQVLASGESIDVASVDLEIIIVGSQLNESTLTLDGAKASAQTLLEVRQRRNERVSALAIATTAASADAARLDERINALGMRRAKFITSHGEPLAFETVLSEHTERCALLKTHEEELDERDRHIERQRASEVSLATLMVDGHVDNPSGLRPLDIDHNELVREREEITARTTARATVLERIRIAEQGGLTIARPEVDELTEAARAAREQHTVAIERRTALSIHSSAFIRDVATLHRDRATEVQLRVAAEEADTLARLCAGNTAGQDRARVSLQDWVLAVYLKDVLAHANLRLERMTNGRYSLQVSPEDGDGRGRHGLDIEVFDTFTGCPRPAASMSGGETFQCALALALGLSDVIAAGSNYELGALFIDEGFDTLDPGALEEVLTVLEGLQSGGRMVGVISHIEDLHRAMPQGITVRVTPSGSSAEFHYPDE